MWNKGEWKGELEDVWDLFACLFVGVLAVAVGRNERKSCRGR
jgi:hypothetical protein